MRVIDIVKRIKDVKVYIEVKYNLENGGGSFGFYTKNEIHYNDKISQMKVDNINVQYIDNKRVIVLEVK